MFRNDAITVDGIRRECPTHVVVSPGPCTPNEAGISLQVVAELAGEVPILGVCLGHQSIGQAFGARVTRGDAPVHGKTSPVFHDGRTIFAGLPDPFTATRYHSLVVRDLPARSNSPRGPRMGSSWAFATDDTWWRVSSSIPRAS